MENKTKTIIELIVKSIILIVAIIFIPINVFNSLNNIDINSLKICIADVCILSSIISVLYKIISIIIMIDSIITIILLGIYLFRDYVYKYVTSLEKIKNSKIIAQVVNIVELLGYISMTLIMLIIIFIIMAGFRSNSDILPNVVAILTGFGLLLFNIFTTFGDYLYYEKKIDYFLPTFGFLVMIFGIFFL